MTRITNLIDRMSNPGYNSGYNTLLLINKKGKMKRFLPL